MSDRLKLFRKLMSAFEGSSNPQQAIDTGFYIDLPNNPVGEIARRVELRPSSVHLLLGGIGSGKTTQLLLATERLNQLEDIKAIYVDVTLYIDISELEIGKLIIIAALELLKLLDQEKVPYSKEYGENVKKLAYGYTETEMGLPISELLNSTTPFISLFSSQRNVTTHHKGLLEKRETENKFARAFSELSEHIKEEFGKEIMFLFDGLDRLGNSKIFSSSALEDVNQIQKCGYGITIVGSVFAAYIDREAIEKLDCYSYYLPYLDIGEDEKAYEFFAGILAKRDSDNFITPQARLSLISNSGGVLRDLMSLAQSSIEEAYFDGSDNIDSVHLEKAVLSLTRTKLAGLTKEGLQTIKQILGGQKFFPQSIEDFELLSEGYILEYRYPYRRFAVHPVIEKYISSQVIASVVNG